MQRINNLWYRIRDECGCYKDIIVVKFVEMLYEWLHLLKFVNLWNNLTYMTSHTLLGLGQVTIFVSIICMWISYYKGLKGHIIFSNNGFKGFQRQFTIEWIDEEPQEFRLSIEVWWTFKIYEDLIDSTLVWWFKGVSFCAVNE